MVEKSAKMIGKNTTDGRKSYYKVNTVILEMDKIKDRKAAHILKTVVECVGHGKLLAIRLQMN